MNKPFDPKCRRHPEDIPEYVAYAKVEGMTPDEFAMTDGTYNYENGHFLCTECYIKAGMPSSEGGWKCP